MYGLSCRRVAKFASFVALAFLGVCQVRAQLTWDQQMDDYSAILPLTLENSVYRVRAKPPEGIMPQDIICDIGITGTVLTDQRGTSASDRGEKVVGGLLEHDDIDVQFADRVFSGNRDLVGNRIIDRYDFDCGINIKYENKKKVAQVEIRVGYVLPSGDIEGLTWAKIRRKQRHLEKCIAKCATYKDDIVTLQNEARSLIGSASNSVERMRANARITGINRQIRNRQDYVLREAEFRRDLSAFATLNEYLKTKIHGCQVYVHFHHNGTTLPVDIDELKRARVRPIQVFDPSNDPILTRADK